MNSAITIATLRQRIEILEIALEKACRDGLAASKTVLGMTDPVTDEEVKTVMNKLIEEAEKRKVT